MFPNHDRENGKKGNRDTKLHWILDDLDTARGPLPYPINEDFLWNTVSGTVLEKRTQLHVGGFPKQLLSATREYSVTD